eukprot:3627249-Amphidinium_carterae.2
MKHSFTELLRRLGPVKALRKPQTKVWRGVMQTRQWSVSAGSSGPSPSKRVKEPSFDTTTQSKRIASVVHPTLVSLIGGSASGAVQCQSMPHRCVSG